MAVSDQGSIVREQEFRLDLRADAQFLRLQQELVNTEDRIQASRRFFNANVRDLNNRVESILSSVVAGMAGIGKAEFFEVDDFAIRAPVPVGP